MKRKNPLTLKISSGVWRLWSWAPQFLKPFTDGRHAEAKQTLPFPGHGNYGIISIQKENHLVFASEVEITCKPLLLLFLSALTACFLAAFPRHQCSLEELGGTPLNVVWVSGSEALSLVLREMEEEQAGFYRLASLPSVALPASVNVLFSVCVCFPPVLF